jgi:non-haem dioxygenase in morphine synthesis N-terminal
VSSTETVVASQLRRVAIHPLRPFRNSGHSDQNYRSLSTAPYPSAKWGTGVIAMHLINQLYNLNSSFTMAPSIAQLTSTQNFTIPPYQRPEQTKEDLDWAPLVNIDVSRFDEPGEKQRLAAQLEDTIRNVGFWIVTGHGITDEEIRRALTIGNGFFHLPMEEKVKVPIDLGNDLNWGYREPVRMMGPTGYKESVETVLSMNVLLMIV